MKKRSNTALRRSSDSSARPASVDTLVSICEAADRPPACRSRVSLRSPSSPAPWTAAQSRISPMRTAASPPGALCNAASAAPAYSSPTTARNWPSFAMCSGSSPSSSQAPRTVSRTGIRSSNTSTPAPESRASSFSDVATPPRVGSRIQRIPGPAAFTSASTSGSTGRVSEQSSASRSRSPRASRIVMP